MNTYTIKFTNLYLSQLNNYSLRSIILEELDLTDYEHTFTEQDLINSLLTVKKEIMSDSNHEFWNTDNKNKLGILFQSIFNDQDRGRIPDSHYTHNIENEKFIYLLRISNHAQPNHFKQMGRHLEEVPTDIIYDFVFFDEDDGYQDKNHKSNFVTSKNKNGEYITIQHRQYDISVGHLNNREETRKLIDSLVDFFRNGGHRFKNPFISTATKPIKESSLGLVDYILYALT